MIYSTSAQSDGILVTFRLGEQTLTCPLFAMTSVYYQKNSGMDIEVTVNLTDSSTSNLHALADELERLSTKIRRYADSILVRNKA